MPAEVFPAVVVGAGPAGLAASTALARRGIDPLLVEAAERPGGRLVTDEVDGFLLDRGFQVVNTAYPALPRYAPLAGLRLRALPSAATVLWEGRQFAFGNPLSDPRLAPGVLGAPFAGPGDLARLALAMVGILRSNRAALAYPAADISAAEWLRQVGLSTNFIDAFFRPFFGGVLLDPGLTCSARCLRYDLRQFVVGRAALPERGIRAVPELIVGRLDRTRVRLSTRVAALLRGDRNEVAGVRLAGGEEIRARVVIVATEAPEAARLTGLPLPTAGNGEVCVHVATDRPLLPGGRLLLDPRPGADFANLVEPSAVAPSYAPAGSSLLMLVAPGQATFDRDWAGAALDTIHHHFHGLPAKAARVLRVDRITFGVLSQPPGFHSGLDRWRHPAPGLFLAGEETLASSLNAALLAGERAARDAAADLRGA